MSVTTECDVLVVGAGPAGVAAGLLLGDSGVRTVVVDRHSGISELPRARGIHARATEILRRLRVEDDMVASALPITPRLEVRRSLGEPPDFASTTGGDTWSEVSPCEGIAIAQDVFEGVLRAHLARRGSVTFRTGQRLTALQPDADPVRARIVDEASGETCELTARYVIGADGWRSDVRRLCAIGFTGPEDLGRRRSVRFRAGLTPWLGSPPPAFITLTSIEGALLPTHPDGRWVLIAPAAPGEPITPEEFVRAALRVEVAIEVLGDSDWVAGVQLADTFGAGRIFLIGDAAHRVTPAGATGISAALADAHNLVWKLVAVLDGWGGPGLLPSYDQERREVARVACTENLRIWQEFAAGRQPSADLRMLDMGYRYASPIVIAEPAAPAAGPAAAAAVAPAGAETSAYRPGAAPGARAPHTWLDRDGHRISTLDLFGDGFTLLTGPTGGVWRTVAVGAGAASAVPLRVEEVTEPTAIAALGIGQAGAVLVRPDGHVAWRSSRDSPPEPMDAADLLTRVLATASGH